MTVVQLIRHQKKRKENENEKEKEKEKTQRIARITSFFFPCNRIFTIMGKKEMT